MKVLLLPALAGLIAVPMPACAADLATNQTELHIEATGSVIADSVIYAVTYNVADHGKPACDAAIAQSVASTKTRLLAAGLSVAAITLSFSACEANAGSDGLINSMGYYQQMGVFGTPPVANPGTDSAAAARNARIEAERQKMALPVFVGKIALSVKADDLSKLAAIQRAVGGVQFDPTAAHTTSYQYKNPSNVHATALADALAKARKEADLFANALGCHVVGIVRLSNHAGLPNLPELVHLFDDFKEKESVLVGSQAVSIAVDYTIAPN